MIRVAKEGSSNIYYVWQLVPLVGLWWVVFKIKKFINKKHA